MTKYHNIKTGKYDSRKEAKRAVELGLLQRAGQIKGLAEQVKFELLPPQDGEHAVHYIADFMYIENGKEVVEDVKGVRTSEYIIKRKMMLYFHDIRIREV